MGYGGLGYKNTPPPVAGLFELRTEDSDNKPKNPDQITASAKKTLCVVCGRGEVDTSAGCQHFICSVCYLGMEECPVCRTELSGLYVSV